MKFLRCILLVPIYIIIVTFQNLNVILSNISNNVSILNNVNKFSLTIFVSMVIVAVILIYYNNLKKYKKLLISIAISMISFSLISGMFVNRSLDRLFLLYIYLIFMSFVISNIIKKDFNISLFVTVISMILVSIAFGIFGLLKLLIYMVVISIIFSAIYLTKKSFKNKKAFNERLQEFSGANIIIFSIFFVILSIGGISRYVHVYDEYSHWGFDAKVVILLDKFSTCEEITSQTRSYPPAMSIWHYIVSIFTNTFSEEILYIGQSIFDLIFIMPIFSLIKKKNKILLPLVILVAIFGCTLLSGIYTFSSLYADLPLTVAFLSTFIMYLLYKNDEKTMKKYITLSLLITTLIKPNGFVLAAVFIFMLVIKDYLEFTDYNITFKDFFKKIIKLIKKWWKVVAVIMFVFLVWNVYVKICDAKYDRQYSAQIMPDGLRTELSYKLNEDTLKGVVGNLFKSFNQTIIFGNVNINLYQVILIFYTLLIFVLYIENDKNIKIALKKSIPYIVGYITFFFLTLLSMFVMFSAYEASKLASFARYLNTFNISLLLFLIFRTCSEDFIKKSGTKKIGFALLFIVAINLKPSNILYFGADFVERKQTIDVSYERREKFDIVNRNTSEKDRIFVIDQQDKDGIMAMWYARYYLFPRVINSSSSAITWKIKTDKNAYDLQDWGLTNNTLENHLIEYDFDYLFLYTSDELMFENMKYLFENEKEARKYTLFKIQKNSNNTVTLIPVE